MGGREDNVIPGQNDRGEGLVGAALLNAETGL